MARTLDEEKEIELYEIAKNSKNFKELSEEHKQLADWLEELKELRQMRDVIESNANALEQNGYNKAIDDYFNELCKASESARPVGWTTTYQIVTIDRAKDIAEQLKSGDMG